MVNYVITTVLLFIAVTLADTPGKYRVCIVDGKGSFKKASLYCPVLDEPDSKVECVLGLDRMDCLRKVHKASADFSVFTAEDLITAANSRVEVLITNEMRFTKDNFEYEVVAVINNAAGITNRYDLREKRLCHPGYGYETDWTSILANYLEASVVPQSCNPSLTLTENRIKASSEYFKTACKAGPWVRDEDLDRKLKRKYHNLCDLCDVPSQCSTNDKYWGRSGPLLCLTDGSGDISWARLDDVNSHFGLSSKKQLASPENYSFLCPDGTVIPVNSSRPCVWVVKPWPVVATRRTVAQEIQALVSNLSHDDPSSWQSALMNLIETYHVDIVNVEPIEAIESYLERAQGYLSANSFTGCHPPRTIRICTTSNIENAKCGWLRESAAVYGIEPNIDCLKANDTEHCLEAVKDNKVDVVVIPPDLLHKAKSFYHLKPLLYETVPNSEKYITVAVTRKNDVSSFSNLKGKKACFPVYDGVAWNSVFRSLTDKKLIPLCSPEDSLSEFFGDSCTPGLPENSTSSLRAICKEEFLNGDIGALNCLTSGNGDVAFVSENAFYSYFKDIRIARKMKSNQSDFEILCAQESKEQCHLSWAPAGYLMIRSNNSDVWEKDTADVFLQMDNLFGKNHKSLTVPLTMFGLFDGKPNILFHDATSVLRETPYSKNIDTMPEPYSGDFVNTNLCSASLMLKGSMLLMILTKFAETVSVHIVNFLYF